ncbi:chlorophyll synthase ChlG [Planktomarina temperata]|jgi:chlorophyll synthase|uniref:Bacteriochlorophyll synthase BchG n=2 Tax=Pseudomonadota TaxID=1224 RepID=A0AAN0RLS6_9RHOB|nr:geranylgeranyl bacteriochlorophyll synthase [uncultured marine proteobacterium]AII88475.1 bacteriochlorophyll synthase BchG [Planktomarina temperata RCA23]MBT6020720.1 chlorophyll synthase ChlG [Planktomarina temperata]MDA8742246.1 chlorophyll synthase ChlG [bacterium]MDG2462247.1 chlorophyll synthase ChlG [Planktomarina sp.]
MTEYIPIEPRRLPEPMAMLLLLKPITWFPPMWAFLCGIVSSGASVTGHWVLIIMGLVLAGPIVCGMSQAANDWCDRHVDAINEPDRPIPSGRIPGKWGLWIAWAMSALSLLVGYQLGPWGFAATIFGVLAAWAYSAEPLRLKISGWWGPGLVGLCYEGLPWFTGAAVLSAGAPDWRIILLAGLYALGAHGIMTLNDFKATEGDRQLGINSLPVTLGSDRAARLACWIMGVPQGIIIALLIFWDRPVFAGIIAALLAAQFWAMRVMLTDPKARAPWYNATGVSMYVSGMMISAIALRGLL